MRHRRWQRGCTVTSMITGESVRINGDGETSRDFSFVANAVHANVLAATTTHPEALNQVYNMPLGDRTTLNELFALIRDNLAEHGVDAKAAPEYRDFRAGDVRHSQADVSKSQQLLGYKPTHRLSAGLGQAMPWYIRDARG